MRIGIKGNDVAAAADAIEVSNNLRILFFTFSTQCCVEIGQLAALAFPAHPNLVPLIPHTRAMEK